MTHAQIRRRLSEYVEGELSPHDEQRLEAHLGECAACAAELRALERSIEWLHGLPAPEPRYDLSAAVLARLRAGEGRSRRELLLAALGERRSLGWLAPMAAAVALGAVAWLGNPEMLGGERVESGRNLAEMLLPGRAEREEAERRGGIVIVPAGAPRPSMQACVERSRQGQRADECAAWYAWFVAMALEDAHGFAHEVAGLPPAARDSWLQQVSEFAARSGSAPLVGDQLRSSHDPGAVRIARRFERGSVSGIRTVGWQSAR
jgi:Putative zinc-finger